MAATDQAMKRLIQEYPEAMLALALPGATFVRMEPTELEGLAMSSDLTELFEQSWLYRRWVSEAQAKGLQQGLQQGEERGKHDGVAGALRIIIERRFGPLTNDVRLALVAGDVSTLENATAVAATGTLEDVRVALGL